MLDDALAWKVFLGFTKLPFHIFDRYEIHIQAFGDFINRIFIIFGPHLRKIQYSKVEIRKLRNISPYTYPAHAHLDRRCFMFIVSPKKVVGCRGGNRYVEWEPLTFG